MTKRADDDEKVIRTRFHVYQEQTKPLIDYYTKKKLIINVDGVGEAAEVIERVLKVL